jgi:hypothetical protein
MKTLTCVAALCAILIVTQSAHAASAVAKACAADIKAQCPDIKPGGGKLKACVKAHFSDLSTDCQVAIITIPEQFLRRVPKALISANLIAPDGRDLETVRQLAIDHVNDIEQFHRINQRTVDPPKERDANEAPCKGERPENGGGRLVRIWSRVWKPRLFHGDDFLKDFLNPNGVLQPCGSQLNRLGEIILRG